MLTQERLKELMRYDKDTGLFFRIEKLGNNSNMKDSCGVIDSHGYLECSVDGNRYRIHRLAWLYVTGCFPIGDIDHIDAVRSNNKFSNLRDVSRVSNCQNRTKPSSNNKSGYLGVFLHKKLQRYTAQIRINGKNKHLGMFDTPELAHKAYIDAKRIYHEGSTL